MVVGASGLVGGQLVSALLEDPGFAAVRVFVRRPSGAEHERLEERVVDFERISDWAHDVVGDVLFSALGTTARAAGGAEGRHRVDFAYNLRVAQAARTNDVVTMVLVSSAGADATSKSAYMRTKGQLEEALAGLGFERLIILQPALLTGVRTQRHLGEELAAPFVHLLTAVPGLRRYRPIPARCVADAMRVAAKGSMESGTVRLDEIFALANASIDFGDP